MTPHLFNNCKEMTRELYCK